MSVVGGGGRRGSKVWRRERIEMTDPDLDDVAFLSGVCVCVSPVRSGSSTISFSTRISDQILYFIEPAFPIQYEI